MSSSPNGWYGIACSVDTRTPQHERAVVVRRCARSPRPIGVLPIPDSPAITTQRIPPPRTASQSSVDARALGCAPDEGQGLDSGRLTRRARGADRGPRRAPQEREICGLGFLRRAHAELVVEPAPALLVDGERVTAAPERVVRGHQRARCDLVERIDLECLLGPRDRPGRARPAPSAASVAMCSARSRCPRTRSCQRLVHCRVGRGEEGEAQALERLARELLCSRPTRATAMHCSASAVARNACSTSTSTSGSSPSVELHQPGRVTSHCSAPRPRPP